MDREGFIINTALYGPELTNWPDDLRITAEEALRLDPTLNEILEEEREITSLLDDDLATKPLIGEPLEDSDDDG